MGPALPLPLHDEWEDVDSYIEALLNFATSTPLFLNLCGGVHILDFLTSEPDLYTTLIAADWRAFFHEHDLYDILDLILTDDLSTFRHPGGGWKTQTDANAQETWKNGPLPPASLLDYIHDIRRFSLRKDFTPPTPLDDATTTVTSPVPHRLAFGMKDKKLHEVEHFSRYVDSFAASVSDLRQEPITHIADFGSGQNYLGRTLAYSFNRNIIAIERKHDFIKGAQGMDVVTRVAKKKVVRMYNKKAAMALQREKRIAAGDAGEVCESCLSEETANNSDEKTAAKQQDEEEEGEEDNETVFRVFGDLNLDVSDLSSKKTQSSRKPYEQIDLQPRGTMNYIEHNIKDGYLEPIIRHVVEPPAEEGQKTSTTAAISEQSKAPSSDTPSTSQQARVLVVSLHSCGNLLHHGIRSLILNPSVVAIAMIGCCYNLLTERLGPATYKLPVLRHMHQRLSVGATEKDPHGFPMSNLFENYTYAGGKGIKFNITARMMACQAPFNWSREETEAFFLRHYYRALLQKFFVDHGVAPKPQLATLDVLTKGHSSPVESSNGANGNDQNTWDTSPPLVIGTLRKTAYKSFTIYAQAAMAKLAKEPAHFSKLAPLLENEVATLDELEQYVATYKYAKKNLSIVWVLMSFSAMLVEAMIVIDRWQYLREHMASGIVKECWVEPVFDYAQSPRNLAVIGIKK